MYKYPLGLVQGICYFTNKGDGRRNMLSQKESVSLGGIFSLLTIGSMSITGSEINWRQPHQYQLAEPKVFNRTYIILGSEPKALA